MSKFMCSFPNATCEFIESPQNHKIEMLNVDGMILQAKRLLFFWQVRLWI